jgi:hypothetical protein
VSDLTKILPREQYIAKIMGSLNMPVTSLVSVLANTIRGFMNVMNALIDKQGGVSESASAESTGGATEAGGDTGTAPEATATTEDATAEAASTEDTTAETAMNPEDGASAEGSTEAEPA